jgi:hypothetical protein
VTDKALKAKLAVLQEKQLDKHAGIDGNWLVLGDCSGSMEDAIEVAKLVAATLARMVRGNVHLIFFNYQPVKSMNVTGKTYEDILEMTKLITAHGGTSIGCGLQYALDNNLEVDGIAIISDAKENRAPWFSSVFRRYATKIEKDIPVYLYRMKSQAVPVGYYDSSKDLADLMRLAEQDLQEFDLREGVDYYSLPNVIVTMRANRYSLADQIMETPLLTVEGVLKRKVRTEETVDVH